MSTSTITATTTPAMKLPDGPAWNQGERTHKLHTETLCHKPCCAGVISVINMSSQTEPVNSGAHVHSNILGELLHIPSLRQGLERHMLMSISQFLPCAVSIITDVWSIIKKNHGCYIHQNLVNSYTDNRSRDCCIWLHFGKVEGGTDHDQWH